MSDHIAIYPGSFDPMTLGHLDIIQRSLDLVDTLIVGIGTNPSKNPLFSLEERQKMVECDIASMGLGYKNRIIVKPFTGLLVDFARQNKARTVIRGLRAISDFEYEFQMAAMNKKIDPNLETVFLMASDKYQFIASKFVKEIALLGGPIHTFVTPKTKERVAQKISQKK